jgi:hypothetical protein
MNPWARVARRGQGTPAPHTGLSSSEQEVTLRWAETHPANLRFLAVRTAGNQQIP